MSFRKVFVLTYKYMFICKENHSKKLFFLTVSKKKKMQALLTCLRAAAEPTRLRLLALCAEGDVTVSEFTDILGQSQPSISRHLKLLCDAGLISRFREGARVYYRLVNDGVETGDAAQLITNLLPKNDVQLMGDSERLDVIKRSRAAEAEEYFRANAARWDSLRSLHTDEADVEHVLQKRFSTHVPDLLDIGTGTGRMLQLFSDRIDRGVGIDNSRDMLAVARANLEQAGLRHCHVQHGDMYRLPIRQPKFDAVIIHQVLHYAQNPAAVISEASRVLKIGGFLHLIDFLPHNLEELRIEHTHHRLGFDDSEIMNWCDRFGLEAFSTDKLPGKPLTVGVWTAIKSDQFGISIQSRSGSDVNQEKMDGIYS